MGLGKGCLCQPERGAGAEEAAGLWGLNSVLERQPHSPMLHSPHSAGEAHKTLAVSQGLGEGSGKKQGRKQNHPPPSSCLGPTVYGFTHRLQQPACQGRAALRVLSESSSCLPIITAKSETLSSQRWGDGKFQKAPM